MQDLPILYSFRRCPYAIRARMTLAYAGIDVVLREVVLRSKPVELLQASPKGTVPVLLMPDGSVLDESIAIIHWALSVSDPDGWLSPGHTIDPDPWIESNDGEFKQWLDRYKYADRYPEQTAEWYRAQAEPQLQQLENLLRDHPWFHGERMGLVDVALFPFVRQFAMVDYAWFTDSSYRALGRWLETWLAHPLFLRVMTKYPPWEPGQASIRLSAA